MGKRRTEPFVFLNPNRSRSDVAMADNGGPVEQSDEESDNENVDDGEESTDGEDSNHEELCEQEG